MSMLHFYELQKATNLKPNLFENRLTPIIMFEIKADIADIV